MVLNKNKKILVNIIDEPIDMPEDLRNKINEFWKEQVSENPSLFNGEDWNVTEMKETDNEIIFTIRKTNYAHYLYDERHGMNEKFACYKISAGVYVITADGYGVTGELDTTTSFPRCIQIAGGGIDRKDIKNGSLNIIDTAKRELMEEMGLNLNDKNQFKEYDYEYLEVPEGKRHCYSIIIKAKSVLTKKEIEKHFEKYKKILEENNKEREFSKLHFFKIGKAVKELDMLDNPKRTYIRQMLSIEDNVNNREDNEIEI